MKTIGIAGPCRSKAVKLGVDDDKSRRAKPDELATLQDCLPGLRTET